MRFFFRDWRQEVFERAEMKSILMLLAVAPQMIFGLKTPETTDNEKFQEPLTPSQSLYCNDLNPQSHLDFNMVNDAEKVARDWRKFVNHDDQVDGEYLKVMFLE